MSLLQVGSKCDSCSLIDFLPFTCPHCARTFCRDHIHTHGCAYAPAPSAAPARKRIRGTCARPDCIAETIESIGGLEEDIEGEGIARQVRCNGCGEAFCIAHRSQDAHECAAPREDTARHDAGMARRAHAQEVLARTMPERAGQARLTMPKQVDRTRAAPPSDPTKLPPSVIAEQEAERAKKTAAEATAAAATTTSTSAPAPAPAPTPSSSTAGAYTETVVYQKLHKVHCVKIRSLSKPLDARTPRDQSKAVEWTVDVASDRVRAFAARTDSFKPDKAAESLGERKAERIWVPDVMPGGKLLDTLVASAKLPRDGEPPALVRVSLLPGPRAPPVLIDLARPAGQQMEHGDILVLVRGWT